GRIREDSENPRSTTLRLPKKLKRPQRQERNTPERCEDGKAVSPVSLLRIVRAVVIYRTHSTLLLICQGARQPHALPTARCCWLSRRTCPGTYPSRPLWRQAIAVLCKKAAGEISTSPVKTRSLD